MRTLPNYSLGEWLRLRPVEHRLKRLRNRATMRAYCRRGNDVRDAFLAAHPELNGADLAVTIAFNTPWCIDLWLRSMRVNVPGCRLLVADNSHLPAARAEIAALCRAAGVAYISLPPNPVRSPNRSHGLALNWIWRQLVMRLAPRMVAFTDHDLFPVEPFDLAATVARQPVYGLLKTSPWEGAWSLWAGYCVYNCAAVAGYDVDFTYDSPLLLDTGGLNWQGLYRHLDRTKFRFCSESTVSFRDAGGRSLAFHRLDTFLHFGGASYRQEASHEARFAVVAGLIGRAEAQGGAVPV